MRPDGSDYQSGFGKDLEVSSLADRDQTLLRNGKPSPEGAADSSPAIYRWASSEKK